MKAGRCLATNYSIFGDTQNQIDSPADGVILGMTTMPAAKPGEPVFHFAVVTQGHAGLTQRIGSRKRAQLHKMCRRISASVP